MCDCVKRVNAQLAPKNSMLAMGLGITADNRMIGRLLIQTEKLDRNKRGAKSPAVVASYCPFCGGEVKDDEPAVNPLT